MTGKDKRKPNLAQKLPKNTESENWTSITILFLYGFVTILTPSFGARDSNGTKFLAFTLLNAIILAYFLIIEYKKKDLNQFLDFFKTKIGIIYCLLIIISLLSFSQSYELSESILLFAKLFTTFTATWIISTIISKDEKALNYLIIALTGLLIFDSIQVFTGINQYIQGSLKDIYYIRADYSNKNILAAAIFIKIPFALYLITYKQNWLKKLGLIGFFVGSISILFLSTRSFYLGLIVIVLSFISFLLIRYRQSKNKIFIKELAAVLGSFFISILIYGLIQNYLFPKDTSIYNQNIADRISTIQDENVVDQREQAWDLTLEMIKKYPLMGVGLGNWKIQVLEKENPTKADFTYQYKVHNDFLEIIAETGIFGGLCYIALFVLTTVTLIKNLFWEQRIKRLDLLFLATFGLLAYSFDAFFNFPQERSQIQALFAIYLGISIAVSLKRTVILIEKPDEIEHISTKKIINKDYFTAIIIFFTVIITFFSSYLLYLNFKSLQVERLIQTGKTEDNLPISSQFLIDNFPNLPKLTNIGGEPINTFIAGKLIAEKKYEEVKQILKENISPFDTRREFYLSYAYFYTNELDSAEHYIKYAYKLKPKHYIYPIHYANILEKLGRNDEAITLLDSFLVSDKKEIKVWLSNIGLNRKIGNEDKAKQLTDLAYQYFPSDSTISNLRNYYIYNYSLPHYQDAIENYNTGNYNEAARLFEMSESEIKKLNDPDLLLKFSNLWAHSLLQANESNKAKVIFERVHKEYPKNYFALKNLGFIAIEYDKNTDKAIDYYTKSLSGDSPDYFQSFMNLGTMYLIQGKKDLAISNYENSLKYNTSEAVIRNLVLLWREKGNKEKTEYYESLLLKQ